MKTTAAAKFFHSQLSLLKPLLNNCSLGTVRWAQDKLGRLIPGSQRGRVVYEDVTVHGAAATLITPKDEISGGIILYLHGGGYIAGRLEYARGFGTVLAAGCGMRVLALAYRLAPEDIYPAAADDAMYAYGHLLSSGYDPSQILLCGESAGGGLCYSLCLRLKSRGWPLPAGIVAISPWTDLTSSGPSYSYNEKNDPSMTKASLQDMADFYLYGAEGEGRSLTPRRNPDPADDLARKRDPDVSPLYGDLSGMPPSLVFVGGNEIMRSDAEQLCERLVALGSAAELHAPEGMWHGYVLYGLKQNRGDFDKIRRFIKQHVPHQKKLRWMSLDNAAKIFPAARSRNWSNVFRLSATLTEAVDKEVLQSALDVTVRRFPSIAVRLKTGFFWYYLEEIPAAPNIMEEKPYPLSRMPFDDIRRCAFRVIVYGKRMAVEFFHALTDGNGGLVFLKTLVAEYLYQKYGVKVPIGNGVLDRLEEPTEEELEDSFFKNAGRIKASRADTNAYRLMGKRDVDGFKTNTTFLLDADEVVREAKARGVTVTAYLVSALIMATLRVEEKEIRRPSRRPPVKVLVPVDLRRIFPSRTLRNFVLYATPGVDPRLGEYEFDEVCRIVHHQMHLQVSKKNMAAMIAKNVGDELPLPMRLTPLFLKNLVMKLIFNAVGEKKSCFSFSNLGVVRMPEEFERHVTRMDFVIGVQAHAPYNTSAITYGGRVYLNIIRNIREPRLERALYQTLGELGLAVTVESNSR